MKNANFPAKNILHDILQKLYFSLFSAGESSHSIKKVISACKIELTKGNAKLDPKLPADRLITKWKLWVPENWAEETSRLRFNVT